MVQVTAWRLFSAKPLPEPILSYCQLSHREKNISEIRIELNKNAVLNDATKRIVVQLVYLKEMLHRNIFDTEAT